MHRDGKRYVRAVQVLCKISNKGGKHRYFQNGPTNSCGHLQFQRKWDGLHETNDTRQNHLWGSKRRTTTAPVDQERRVPWRLRRRVPYYGSDRGASIRHASAGRMCASRQRRCLHDGQMEQRPISSEFFSTVQITIRDCKYCGSDHLLGMRNCPAYGKKCNRCGRENHFAFKCREMSPKQRRSGYNRTSSRGQVYQIEEEETNGPSRHDDLHTIELLRFCQQSGRTPETKEDARYSPGWNWEKRTVDN